MSKSYSLLCALCVSAVILFSCRGKPEESKPELILGAYYHPWFGDDATILGWKNYLRKKLAIPQTPPVGEYSCRQNALVKKHIEWAKDCGIDFFAVNWFGASSWTDVTVRDSLLPALVEPQRAATAESRPNREHPAVMSGQPLKFCIVYQSIYILPLKDERVLLNRESAETLLNDFSYLADKYFKHPNYLKVNDKPVVIMALSRLFSGDYTALTRVRAIINQRTGLNLFLVGDEVYWTAPEPKRIGLFDAITTHDMQGTYKYDGLPILTNFFIDLESKFNEYKTAASGMNVGFIPNIMPGFNDRGFRPDVKHPILPRDAALDMENQGTTYRLYFRTAKKLLDPALNMAIITSWNEWYEDTQIEPVASSFTTPAKHPADLTGGYNYYPYNDLYLKITKEEAESNR
ncbi:MAG: glycoside hydrolase family 99-like domain-containing protein [Planctomycetes bacterium]|nr:glycoside hydrolase family 99-like domain-containing protein [Planctomycetota bacterium]